jgi:hypothetical protein
MRTSTAIAVVLACAAYAPAYAQNITCATRPLADGSNACASTAYADRASSGTVTGAVTGLTGDVAATGPGNVTATIQPGAVTSGKLGTGAAATNVGTLGGQLTGTLPNPSIASGTVTNSNLANMAAGTYKCRGIGNGSGSPLDCTHLVYDVTDVPYSADPTGTTANFGTAFNAAMTACHAAAGGIVNATVYIPMGRYKVGSTVPTWLANCNIVADEGAYIQANTSIAQLLLAPSSSALTSVSLQGGQWDCNALTTDGFTIQQWFDVTITHVRMYGCNSGSGGFWHLGTTGATKVNGLYAQDVQMYNFGSNTPTLVANNYGIFTDSGITGAANDIFRDIEIVGTYNCVHGGFFSDTFHAMHCWVFASQGNAPFAFNIINGQARLSQIEVDGPISTAAFGLFGSGSSYSLSQSEYFEPTTNNISNAVLINAGTQISLFGNWFHGNSGATTIGADINTAAGVVAAIGNQCLNVTANGTLCSPASSVNGLAFFGGATGGSPFLKAGGSDTNISIGVQPKGNGTFSIFSNGGVNPGVLALSGSTSGTAFIGTGTTGGHISYAFSGTAPTLTAGCNGAGSSISGTDISGTVGNQTAAATSCTVTFGTAFGSTPRCVVSGHQVAPTTVAPSTGTLVINFSSTANAVFDWVCYGT